MKGELPLLYFESDVSWRDWLQENHTQKEGVYLIFYKLESKQPTMRWEEAVKVALCYGWIDSTVKKLDDQRRKQYFCPRKPKSVWSKINKNYIKELIAENKIAPAGLRAVAIAKENGSWTALDDVEEGIIPQDLKEAFKLHPKAYKNYQNFSFGYRKSYLYWLNQAKLDKTRIIRIQKIIELCNQNIKSRDGTR